MIKVTVLAAAALLLLSMVSAMDEAKLYPTATEKPSTSECDDNCERDFMPVCGSDDVTYGNDCLLDFAHCENSTITKSSDGKCLKQH